MIWTRLSFADLSCDESENELSIQQEFDVILNRFKEVDISGKVQIKKKLCQITYPDKTSSQPGLQWGGDKEKFNFFKK